MVHKRHFVVLKQAMLLSLYSDNELVTTVKIQELENYVTAAQL